MHKVIDFALLNYNTVCLLSTRPSSPKQTLCTRFKKLKHKFWTVNYIYEVLFSQRFTAPYGLATVLAV